MVSASMSPHSHAFAPPPVEEIERRLKWRALPTIVFIVLLALLATAGVTSVVMKPRRPAGLPEDAEAARVGAALAAGAVRPAPDAPGPRFVAALFGGEVVVPASGADTTGFAAARVALEAVRARRLADPRAAAAIAALELASGNPARAADREQRACELAPRYGEARLGAGVARLLLADREPRSPRARALVLEAIAQFAMVDSVDAAWPQAVHDRVLALRAVGRADEAAWWATRDPLRAPAPATAH